MIGGVVVALVAFPGTADAAVTIGSSLAASDTSLAPCTGGGCTIWQASPSGLADIVPSAGVVVRFAVRTALPQSFRLRVIRPGAGSTATVVASSPFVAVSGTDTAQSVNVRLPVRQGDIVALGMTSGADPPRADLDSASWSCFDRNATEPADGSTGTILDPCVFNSELLYNVTIEPDVDGDGYGDETQDGCPTDPLIHDVCPPDLTVSGSLQPASVVPGASVTLGLTVANTGTGPASGVSMSVPLPSGLRTLGASAGAGTCTTAQTVSCAMGTIAAHSSVNVTIKIGTSSAGAFNFSATTFSTTTEPNVTNNTSPFSLAVGGSPPSDKTPPVLRALHLSASRFRALPFGGSIAKAVPTATTVSYRLSEAATVTFTIEHVGRVHGKLKYAKLRGSFRQRGAGGANHMRFSGRLSGKRLVPGAYRLTAVPRDAAGNIGRAARITFQIARR
jgi:uncharacterized repeat protein (TIGR01451 family)